ncbi:MAG: MOSC domain-containing protein [Pseudomonadota bacterium]
MTLALAQIWRHPLKAIGREELTEVDLTAGAWLPFDRLWAVAHDRAKLSNGWAKKANFLRGVTEPALMAATAQLGADGDTLTLDHPQAGQIKLRPDDETDWPLLEDWLAGIWPADRPAPTGIYRADNAHLTDVEGAWLSIHTLASHAAVETALGRDLSIHRWRGNLWLSDAEAWAEKDWVGRTLRIGTAVLEVKVEITRCKATMANPATGTRDADTLGALQGFGHQEFGVYAEVVESGTIALGDTAKLV